jgi:signal transduction histidine kinase
MSLPAPPLSPSEETEYRLHFLRQDSQRMMYGCLVGGAFNLAVLSNDFQLLGDSPAFHLLLALRCGFTVLGIATIYVLLTSSRPPRHDALSLAWGLTVAPLTVVVALTRPDTFTHNLVAEIATVALLYLIMPDIPRWRALPSLLLSLGSLGVLLGFKRSIGEVALQSVVLSYLTANLAFYLVSRQLFRYRRQIWRNERMAQVLAQSRLDMLEIKNRLISTLSHEFRTPLNAIASSASLLSDYRDRLNDVQRREIRQRLDDAVVRMTEMLDEALFIARRDAGRIECRPMPVDVATWLAELAMDIRALHPADGRLTVSIAGESIGVRRIDPELTRLIAENLVANACKFTPAPGQIDVSIGCGMQGMTLRVRDEGIGIPDADRSRIFEAFYRAGNAELIRGTGLGLAIVKEAVDLLEGRITVDSAEGRGTVFEVYLPWQTRDDD